MDFLLFRMSGVSQGYDQIDYNMSVSLQGESFVYRKQIEQKIHRIGY